MDVSILFARQYFSGRAIILGPQVQSAYLLEVSQAMNYLCVKGNEDTAPK
jgi:hypothetical protein